ncbi:sigma factor, partial [Ralstonia pseudosolanacearum]
MPDLFDPTVDLLTDAQRFAQAVLPHVDAAYNLARWLCGDAQDADDIVQEACLRAFRLFGGFRGGDGRPWLLAIVRNTWFSECARRRQAHTQPWQDEADLPRYYLRAPIIGALASQARHDCCPQSPMIRGVLSPGLV